MLCDTAEHVLLTARYLSYGCKGQQIMSLCFVTPFKRQEEVRTMMHSQSVIQHLTQRRCIKGCVPTPTLAVNSAIQTN